MRKTYKRDAYLLDDGILLEGYTSKGKFYPYGFDCGFSYQKFKKRDIGKILFYDKETAIIKCGLTEEDIKININVLAINHHSCYTINKGGDFCD